MSRKSPQINLSTTRELSTLRQIQERDKARRSAALYPVLKDNKHWNNWNCSVLAQAQAHDLKEIFDTTYQLSNKEEKKLFREKQKFAYALLNWIV
jgi:hypothetical protein